MMDMLTQYVKNLALFMIFASVCQIIMPEGRFKGAVCFVTGIMLMLIILKPVNAVLNTDGRAWLETSIRLNTYAAQNELEQYGNSSTDMVISGFEAACADMLEGELGAEKVGIKAENGEEGVYISDITVIIKNGDTEKIKSTAARLCGIDENKVTVIKGGVDEYNEADK